MDTFIQKLVLEKALKTPSIISAFKKIHRIDFIPEAMRQYSDEDRALPTFENQTISQPYTVAFMLELLQPMRGEKILDVGSGSGWVAGMLAHIVGKKGKVYSIELVPELVQFSIDNLAKYRFNNLKIINGDGSLGLPKIAPFDAIHVAAAGKIIPRALKVQLKIGGRMVIPTQKNDIRLIIRTSENKWKEKIYPGFVFVPLI
ncbi:MAG: L-isoaspartyl protein carboxyl methyltransferase [Parcubacteria group bacterium GW2011_GWA2_38_13]|nr:MAG: L-isoaspartyl protein carboxyl methyltransferase [Parcubacteria group bacterium GW2011_GWA2_38_13]